MKYACLVKCQYRNSAGKVRMAARGQVVDFPEGCDKDSYKGTPPFESHWVAVGAIEVDFSTMSEDELTAATWKFSDAAAAVEEEFGVELKKTDKADIIKQIIDARFRQAD